MSRLLILVIIIFVVGFLWYQRQERTKASERKAAEERQLRATAAPEHRATLAAATPPPLAAPVARADAPPPIAGRFKDAADAAAALQLETATDQMEDLASDLAAARAKADLDAARLASQADEALAEVQAAAAEEEARFAAARAAAEASLNGEPIVAEEIAVAKPGSSQDAGIIDVVEIDQPGNGRRFDPVAESMAADGGEAPPGSVRGDGGRDCPPTYPIKASRGSMLFLEPGTSTYRSMIPEFCFSSVESATAAGYSPPESLTAM